MLTMLTLLILGVLIQCEPAIKSIIVHLDSDNNDIIIEDLDEQTLVVKENMVQLLKQKLEDVSLFPPSLLFRVKSIFDSNLELCGAMYDYITFLTDTFFFTDNSA